MTAGDRPQAPTEGRLIRIHGLVQGVGFRPTVWRIATSLGLAGHVRNDAAGVEIALWCGTAELATFRRRLEAECPPLARIDRIEVGVLAGACPPDGFRIATSLGGEVKTGIVADAACCPQCLAEILDPGDRRYFHPFANCTHCGPRLSIIESVPYDRAATSMRRFAPCARCRAEYEDPADRRFHAQPIACPDCGPRIWLEGDADSEPLAGPEAVIRRAAALIAGGRILAIKGIGGFHLACDARNEATVARLRHSKQRDGKPLAMMARDLGQVAEIAELSDAEAAELTCSAAPIVLLRRRPDGGGVAAAVAPAHDRLGIMLPYSPLHHLLMRLLGGPLVMTSANRAGAPQCIGNDEARRDLADLCDAWLMHDRDIVNRLDDSVVRCDTRGRSMLRRARGYAPEPIALPPGTPEDLRVLGAGGDLKAAFCLTGHGGAVLSQHLGDLDEDEAQRAWARSLALYQELFDARPDLVVTDRHRDYRSTRMAAELARDTGARLLAVQHHHAHLAACLAGHGRPLDAPAVLGVILDGLGLGEDGTLWGGEFLLGDYRSFRRLAHFDPVAMPGGDRASREPWRNAHAHLAQAFGPGYLEGVAAGLPFSGRLADRPLKLLDRMIARRINTPLASSAGRLFDACAALLGVCFERQSYEGQAGSELEALAGRRFAEAEAWTLPPADGVIRWRGLWEGVLGDLRAGVEPALIAARFHRTLIAVVSQTALRLAREHRVDAIALSGGVFQNRLLLDGVVGTLVPAGFEVITHGDVPANDGGLALGQAMIGLAFGRH